MGTDRKEHNRRVLLEMDIQENGYDFTSSIDEALSHAELEITVLNETIDSVNALKPECDKLDYVLAASSGAICGVLDIFLVGKPGESPIGNVTDEWFKNRTIDFANLVKDKDRGKFDSFKSAVRFLEKKFDIPYDQTGLQGAAREVFELTPDNHHFKSLSHNLTLLGLFFSILDQFSNTSHFVTGGQLITLEKAKEGFELQGGNVPAKLFCAFVNWFGHIISDVSGTPKSKSRGMGIPSPLWAWSNDIIAIREKLTEKHIIGQSTFGDSFNELALTLFEKGYDSRFQTAQTIPVIVNEMIVRFFYALRRMVKFFSVTEKETQSLETLWKACEPFSNATVKRMLTVAHGTFCLIDAGEATVKGFAGGAGTFNPVEFFLRLNIIGAGRFTVSLYGEAKRRIAINIAAKNAIIAAREKLIVEDYIDGLNQLFIMYDDKELLTFAEDLKNSDPIKAFEKTVILAEKRGVPEEKVLKTKTEGDDYFAGRKQDGKEEIQASSGPGKSRSDNKEDE